MSRAVCGICWCPYGDAGDCACTNEEQADPIKEAVQAELEVILDEWWMCVQSDLENGVKSLNERAAKEWQERYPQISKFGEFLNARQSL